MRSPLLKLKLAELVHLALKSPPSLVSIKLFDLLASIKNVSVAVNGCVWPVAGGVIVGANICGATAP